MSLPDYIRPGAVYRVIYGDGHQANQRHHVRAIVDGRAVVKRWIRHKARWHYEVCDAIYYSVLAERIKVTKKGKQ